MHSCVTIHLWAVFFINALSKRSTLIRLDFMYIRLSPFLFRGKLSNIILGFLELLARFYNGRNIRFYDEIFRTIYLLLQGNLNIGSYEKAFQRTWSIVPAQVFETDIASIPRGCINWQVAGTPLFSSTWLCMIAVIRVNLSKLMEFGTLEYFLQIGVERVS